MISFWRYEGTFGLGSEGGGTGFTGAQGAQGAQGSAGSDRRFKKNIIPIAKSIEKITKIRGVSFMWKKNKNYGDMINDGRRDIGFIAQELEFVIPEVVFGSELTGYAVIYQDIIALCVEAIKEQSDLIDKSEEKLNKLEMLAKEKGLV